MFDWRYPRSQIIHPRVLCCEGIERDLTIYPKPRWTPPPEIVHTHSSIVVLPHSANQVMVIEWTGPDRLDRHLVDLNL